MKYFCIGIKGSGMATLACILSDLGYKVSGYDDYKGHKYTEEGLKKRNIKIYTDQNHIIDKDAIVTYSKAFKNNHPEMIKVKNEGLKIVEYLDVMGDLTSRFKTIGIAGTHGKTSTSHLTRRLLKEVGVNYFVGDGSGYAGLDNEIFVVESDEYNKHFLAYKSELAVILNIEIDHVECYKNGLLELIETFKKFGNNAKRVLANGDDYNIRSISFDVPVKYIGFNENNDIVIKNIDLTNKGATFEIFENAQFLGSYFIPLFGKHMVFDAAVAIYIALSYGARYEFIIEALKEDSLAKRRFDEFKIGSNILIDDYAHHPTELAVTIEAAKQKYQGKEIVAIFLPNTYSRTEALKDDFIKALSLADKAYVMDIEANRERAEEYPGVSSDMIIEGLIGAEKIAVATVSKLKKYENAVLLFMSCTSIEDIENAYKEMIEK